MRYIIFLCFVVCSLQAQNNSTTEKRMQRMLKKLQQYEEKFQNYQNDMEELREEISDLHERLDEVETDERVEDLRNEVEEIIDETQGEVIEERTLGLLNRFIGDHYINISGYLDFEYLNDNKKNSAGTFAINRVSLFLQKKFYRFNFFAELLFEGAPKIVGEDNEVDDVRGEIVMEQGWVEYLHHPLFNVRGGLILTPEYYGTNFFPTTTFATTDPFHPGNIFSQELVGLMLYGDTQDIISPDWGIGYILYTSNGEGDNLGLQDVNENKGVGGKIIFHLPRLGYFDVFDVASNLFIGRDDEDNKDFLWNFELIIETANIFLHFEYAAGRTDFVDPEEQLQKSYGGYLLLGYQFWEQYAVFSRYDFFDEDNRDEEFATRFILGLRYRPFPEVTLKGEIFREWHDDDEEEDFYGVAFSFIILL